MSTSLRFGTFLPLLLAVSVSAFAAACSSETTTTKGAAPAPTDAPPVDAPPATPSTTPPLRETIDPKVVSTLTGAGIDVNELGELDTLLASPSKLKAVMTSFTIALGTTCTGCHEGSGNKVDYEAETPKKKIAKKMWTEFVRDLRKKDGSALYCDSCHQGKMEFLDRADDRSLGAWMKENFVGKLARADRAEHGCATCHGEPFVGDVLARFSK
ncbi:hypothetical protein BH11MYX4_BH11MYX4_28500 [soil metagenome]